MGDCKETLRELEAFLDNEMSTEVQTVIRAHLEGCPDCWQAFDFHAELKVVIAEKCRNDEMPAGLLAKLERCFDDDLDGDGSIG
jgi:mycothiol system anti-sigma-R factor